MLQVFHPNVAFSSRDLEYSMQHKTDVVADFFSSQWMDNNFFDLGFLMLHMVSFYVAEIIFECCMDHAMGDILMGHRYASSAVLDNDEGYAWLITRARHAQLCFDWACFASKKKKKVS